MDDLLVDLTAGKFWLVFVVALLVLTPLRGGRLRSWAWAAVNVAFLKTILYRQHFLVTLCALLFAWLLFKVAGFRSWRVVGITTLAVATLFLFLVHKFPALSQLAPRGVLSVLAAIGFSYVALRMVEVLRAVIEERHPAPALAATINYLVPFHMLAAGPIQSFDEFVTQPPKPAVLTTEQVLRSTERIAWGLFKKFVLASLLQKVGLTGFRVHGWYLVVEAQLFYIWLYLDFSALSDIAVGIGGLLGLATPENFDRPYMARNMIDFWERWHISLSQFIRRNLYMPIQLWLVRRTSAQRPLLCATVAFTVAFGLCGLWHAGTLRFLLWGLLNALGLIVTNLYRYYLAKRLGAKGVKRYLANRPIRALATFVTFEFVAFSLAFIQLPL